MEELNSCDLIRWIDDNWENVKEVLSLSYQKYSDDDDDEKDKTRHGIA